MAYLLPQDNYDTYLSAPAGSADSTLSVNEAPTKTAGVLTVYENDGRTIREKIYYTGVSGTTLTGVVRGIRFVDSAGVVLFTSDSSLAKDLASGLRIAMTDNVNYLGLAIAVLNGDMEMGGVMQLPASRTINSSRDAVDKEYVDALSAGTMSQLLVTKNGSDPTLTVNVASGRFGLRDQTSALYAGAAAQAVTANQTNYIELIATGTGTLAINTSGFTAGRIPLGIAVANGTTITSLTDARQFFIMHDGVIDLVRTWGTVQSFIANNCQITTDPDSANDAVRKSWVDALFFGDGSDGAFSSSSGTTTLNDASKNVYQYTSFSLTGTGVLTTGANIDNKPLIIFVQGDLTITSSTVPAVDRSGKGGPKGTGGTTGDNSTAGTAGGTVYVSNGGARGPRADSGNGGGGGGGYGNAGSNGANGGGTGGTGGTNNPYTTLRPIRQLITHAFIGGGGGGGGEDTSTGNDGGDGGNGGGCVIFIVGGNINITSTITVAGANGSNGVSGTNSGGGGGGGGGGFIGIYYLGSVTANTGTYTVSGGTGGTSGDGGAGGTGGAGQSEVRQIKVKMHMF